MENPNYQKGDRVEFIAGGYKGRTGKIHRLCVLMTDYIYVDFDLLPLERVEKIHMVEIAKIAPTKRKKPAHRNDQFKLKF